MVSSLISSISEKRIIEQVAGYLNLYEKSDILERLKWLGIFDDTEIRISSGTVVDVLVNLMVKKLSYAPGEKDMIIIHDEVKAEFPDRTEQRLSSMRVEGIPHGDSAMSRAVSLPAAIAARHIIEGNIQARGVQMPVLKEIYEPVLGEMESFGFSFSHNTKVLS
jgi:saccharopine dehydrogenase-like NADP-dependent oxidoreductase